MRKTGFTLPELLITLGVIGIAAALIVPAIGNIMPDKNKVLVLNAYSSLGKITNAITDTPDNTKWNLVEELKSHMSAEKGTTWTFTKTANDGVIAIFDVNGSKGDNCIYGTTCKKPDQFKFVIDNVGDTHPADALTMAYLENPTNTKDKKKDFKRAETIAVEDWENKQAIDLNHTRYDLNKVKEPGNYVAPSDEPSGETSDGSSDGSSTGE